MVTSFESLRLTCPAMNPRPIRTRPFVVSLVLVFTLLTSTLIQAQRRTATANQRAKRPKLVLLIVVDQYRYDYLERFSDLFAENGGFKRLLRDGASWTQSY